MRLVINGRRWFLVGMGLLALAHSTLGPHAEAYTFFVSEAMTIPPVAAVWRRAPRHARLPWALMLVSMAVLSSGDAASAVFGSSVQQVVGICVTVGHSALLAGAVSLVLLRGRNDMGGILDVSVAAIGVGGVAWTTMLFPRFDDLHTSVGDQASILVTMLVLSGVAGALLRLWFTERRRPAVGHLLTALLLALIGNTALAHTQGTLVASGGGAPELCFMGAYLFVGLAMLSPSVDELMRPGSAPVDQLSIGRLALLGLALTANPFAGGIREMLGLKADGVLLAVGSLMITPLVMIRVGRLAQQRRAAERRLRHQATHDQLTGLPNRAELLSRLTTAIQTERPGDPAVVLLFCDLNGFKQINDRLGHEAGDQLLAQVAARLGSGLRAGDMVARYGGDEFLLLATEPGGQPATARRLTAHVRSVLDSPFVLNGVEATVSASVGAVISDGVLGADELISRADQAMYRAKQEHLAEAAAIGR
jgi:diguanylate cyclase (GGDEF)-like protein